MSSVRGPLTGDNLAGILREVAAGRKSGILHLSREGVSKRIYFKEGSIVFAGSDDEQERLGEFLIRAGKIKRADLDFALQVMKETGQNLGTTLVEMGFVSSQELQAQALARMRAIICSLFSWESGEFYFEERDASVGEDIAANVPATQVILEGIRSIEDAKRIRKCLGDLGRVLRLPENPLVPYEEGSLSSSVEWIFYQANGVSTMEDIVRSSPLDEDKTLKSIYALLSAGLLEIEGQPPQARIDALRERTRLGAALAPAEEAPPAGEATPASLARLSSGLIPQKLGRYEVQKLIGRGAMGAVLLARDPAIDRTVAVKLIQTAVHLSAAELEKYRERFYREARAAGKLLHPGIVTVFDVGHGDHDTPFIVMEYVEGRTLQEILKTQKLEVDESLRIACDMLDALGYAHAQGVVHRDIKPANILVTREGRVKIMDFGIAHVVGSKFTRVDEVLGSPSYMAPEQLSRGAIDGRTDLFAVAVVLYRMLTGKLPFGGDSIPAIARAIVLDEPAPPEAVNPAVPVSIGRAVLRCLAKDPTARFADAGELQQALSEWEAGEPPLASVELVPEPLTVMGSSGTTPKEPARSKPAPREGRTREARASSLAAAAASAGAAGSGTRRHLSVATSMVALLSVGLVILFVMRGRESRQSPGPEPLVPGPPGGQRTLGGGGLPGLSGGPARRPATQETSAFEVMASEEGRSGEENASGGQVSLGPAPGELELFDEAVFAFERGDLQASKAKLEDLLRRNPGFEGGDELMRKVNDQLRRNEPKPAPSGPEQGRAAGVSTVVTEAELFYQARLALERGELEASQAMLKDLLRRNPGFSGAAGFLGQVNDQIFWKRSLPIRLRAKHNHRIGGCSGTLVLGPGAVSFASSEHDWQWGFGEIRLMEREGERTLTVETYEKDVLGLGKPKNYKFALSQPLKEEDWGRYRKRLR